MDLLKKIIFTLLLLFTPFAFAAAEPWAFSVVQIVLTTVWVGIFATNRPLLLTPPLKWILCGGLFLGVFACLQLIFPSATLADGPQYRPLTLMPLYTWHHLSLLVFWGAVLFGVGQLYPSFDNSRRLVLTVSMIGGLVALCAFSMPNGEYIFKLTGIRGGIGPFMNRNHAGIFFAMISIGLLGLFCAGQVEYAKMIAHRQKQFFYTRQGMILSLFILLSSAVFYTRSRGAMLAWLCGIFGYCFLCFWVVPPVLKKRLRGLFFTLLALLLSAGWITTHTPQINAYAQRATGASEQTRKMLYRAAWQGVKDYPLFGVGVGAMPVMIPLYMEWPLKAYVSHLHCDWLELLLSVGVIGGGILLIFLLGLILTVLLRLKRLDTKKQLFYAGLLNALLVMCAGSVVDYHFFIPADLLVFCVFAGLVCAPTFYHARTRRYHLPAAARVFVGGCLLAALYIPTQYTVAWRDFLFGSGLKTAHKLEMYERGLSHYKSPVFAARTAAAYYNALPFTSSPLRQAYRMRANELADTYLQRYPYDSKLSTIYINTYSFPVEK